MWLLPWLSVLFTARRSGFGFGFPLSRNSRLLRGRIGLPLRDTLGHDTPVPLLFSTGAGRVGARGCRCATARRLIWGLRRSCSERNLDLLDCNCSYCISAVTLVVQLKRPLVAWFKSFTSTFGAVVGLPLLLYFKPSSPVLVQYFCLVLCKRFNALQLCPHTIRVCLRHARKLVACPLGF